eukprot:gnl/MRDRNA2_/MRDRNA2_59844_c0_seq1.p1 gnl/MRDRNA2_/MRDRNA2_59844_c0~~gnl/MRDRNA2_/MRDRNA2_59844_c0_seq1.p1  ORF type:complete len:321 (+),score=70.19 gnl/MRDRNA2_/MRDRNA2_59844_c0_seq1:21-983(+)
MCQVGGVVVAGAAASGPLALAGVALVRSLNNQFNLEKGLYGLLEDESDEIQDTSIKVVNMTMVSIKACLYRVVSQTEPGGNTKVHLGCETLVPGCSCHFEMQDARIPASAPNVVHGKAQDESHHWEWIHESELYSVEGMLILEITREVMFLDKELCESIVWPGRNYVFLRVDAAVQPEGGLPLKGAKEITVRNKGLQAVSLAFLALDDQLGWFPKAQVELEPGVSEKINPVDAGECFKVVIRMHATHTGFWQDSEELATVEMCRGQAYVVTPPANAAEIQPILSNQFAPQDLLEDSDDDEQFAAGARNSSSFAFFSGVSF